MNESFIRDGLFRDVRPFFTEEGSEVTDVFPAKVLLAADAAEETSRAVRVAAELAAKTGSELHLVHIGPIMPAVGGLSGSDAGSIEREAEDVLGKRTREVEDAGGDVSDVHIRKGDPAENILILAEEIGAGVVVVGSRGLSGVKRAFEGSVSDEIVRNSPTPVMVVREEN